MAEKHTEPKEAEKKLGRPKNPVADEPVNETSQDRLDMEDKNSYITVDDLGKRWR